jgi:hypothetical protein
LPLSASCRHLIFLIPLRATIFSSSSGSSRCKAFVSLQGARIQRRYAAIAFAGEWL